MNPDAGLWSDLIAAEDSAAMLQKAMQRVAEGLSSMMGGSIQSGTPQLKRMDFSEVAACAGDPEMEAVGVYLKIETGLQGWALLSIPLDLALGMVDALMETPPSAARLLDPMQKSALAEIGNLALSYFLNAVAEFTGRKEVLLPSPPLVVVDMLGVLLSVVVTPVAATVDSLLVLETAFRDTTRPVRVCFWVVPDRSDPSGVTECSVPGESRD